MIASTPHGTQNAWGLLLLRVMVGWIFLSEDVQKRLQPAFLGAGRFVKIGIPAPKFSGPFVGMVEILYGWPRVVGLFTVFSTIPLLIDIIVAIATTKLVELGPLGFWVTIHDARTDFCMFFGLVAIVLPGVGPMSVDECSRPEPLQSTLGGVRLRFSRCHGRESSPPR